MYKIIKNLLRKHLFDEGAKLIVENTSLANKILLDSSKCFLSNTDGDLHKDKVFYVIQISQYSGFFSNFAYVLNELKIADNKGFIPFIDFQNFKTLYSEKIFFKSSLNTWEYYFNQVSDYKIDDIYNSKNVLISEGFWNNRMIMNVTKSAELKKIFKKYERCAIKRCLGRYRK